jgi:hypothetical protein
MTQKEKRTIAKRLAMLELKLREPDITDQETTAIMYEMTVLTMRTSTMEEMDEIDEMVQDILAKNN